MLRFFVRVFDSGARGRGFGTYLRPVVSFTERHIYRGGLDQTREIGMGIGILAGPSLTADRMLQFGRLCPTFERAKDDGRLIFHLH